MSVQPPKRMHTHKACMIPGQKHHSLTSFGRSRCVSPGNTGTRKSWTKEEKFVAAKQLKDNIHSKVVPLTKDCCLAIQTYVALKDRTPNQLKSWVCNQFKNGSNKARVYWTPKEVEILRKEFERNLDAGILPGLKLCAAVCNQYSEHQLRSAVTVKAWLYNEINRTKRKHKNYF